jgi:glutathione S-transferase
MELTEETPKQTKVQLDKFFDHIEDLLKDGRQYLLNTEKPSAADYALAALGYLAVLPPAMSARIPALERFPDSVQKDIESWRARAAGKFILKMYSEHRFLSSTPEEDRKIGRRANLNLFKK